MLMPKRTKHRKTFRLPYEGKSKGNTELHFEIGRASCRERV